MREVMEWNCSSDGLFRRGERKILQTLVVCEARSPIQGFDFVVPQDSQPFGRRVGRLRWHASPLMHVFRKYTFCTVPLAVCHSMCHERIVRSF